MSKKEKKEKKKKKIKLPISAKQLAIIMAIICLGSFLYKFTIGVMSLSMVMIIAALPTLFVFICKALYAKNMDEPRIKKKRTYFVMMIAAFSFSLLFVLFSDLKVGGIDITHENTFQGWIGLLFILFIILLFVLSIINLHGALNKDDLVVIGIKEVTFISALTDAVMINGFLYRVFLKYLPIPFYDYLNRFFPLGVAILIVVIPFLMLRRFIKYKVDEPEVVEEVKTEEPEPAQIEQKEDPN